MSISKKYFQPLPIVISLIGLLFCMWNIFGSAESICLTNGCSIFQDFNIAGISLWLVGSVFFFCLLLIAFLHKPAFGLFVNAIGLIGDMLLLTLMLFSAPCSNCLIVGLIVACNYLAFLSSHKENTYIHNNEKSRISILILIWIVIFIANIGVLLQNTGERWAILGPENHENSQIDVFFSPTCAACLELVESVGKDQSIKDQDAVISWYPVEEKADDIFIINALQNELMAGHSLGQSLEFAKKDTRKEYTLSMFLLQIKLWINKVAVVSTGVNKLPLVEYHGLPMHLTKSAKINQSINIPSNRSNSTSNYNITKSTLPFANGASDGVSGFCSEANEDC